MCQCEREPAEPMGWREAVFEGARDAFLGARAESPVVVCTDQNPRASIAGLKWTAPKDCDCAPEPAARCVNVTKSQVGAGVGTLALIGLAGQACRTRNKRRTKVEVPLGSL